MPVRMWMTMIISLRELEQRMREGMRELRKLKRLAFALRRFGDDYLENEVPNWLPTANRSDGW